MPIYRTGYQIAGGNPDPLDEVGFRRMTNEMGRQMVEGLEYQSQCLFDEDGEN